MYFSSPFKAVFGLILFSRFSSALLPRPSSRLCFTVSVVQALAYQVKEAKDLVGLNRESFLKYMSTLVDSWVPSEDVQGKDIYYRVVVFYFVFYFVFDQPSLKDLQFPIQPASAQKPLTWLWIWLVQYANAMGAFLDKEGSLTPASLQIVLRLSRLSYG